MGEPKIGEKLPDHESELKKDEPDLRRRICENGDCKEPAPQPPVSGLRRICLNGPCPEPEPPDPDLHRICLKGHCPPPCPLGEVFGKGGCGAPPPPSPEPVAQCAAGTYRNGAVCAPEPPSCPAGQIWNGAQCAESVPCQPGQVRIGSSCRADCTMATAGLAGVTERLRMARHQRDDACRQDYTGTACAQAEASYDLVVSEYRAQTAGIPAECRGTVLDPSAII